MKLGYADPPYPGKARLHYARQPDYAGEVDHPALIKRLVGEFPDGWALSTNSTALRELLPLCPVDVRVGAWVKPWAVWKKNVYPAYSWEPVLFWGGRNRFADNNMVRDWVSANAVSGIGGRRVTVTGTKPDAFCFWIFLLLGAKSGDELVDLFPGSGAVTAAWLRWQHQLWSA